MQKFYSSKVFQFFVITVIVLLCVLFNKLTIINFHKIELPKTSAQYNIQMLDASTYNKTGQLIYYFTSDYAWAFPNSNKIYFKNIQLAMYNPNSQQKDYALTSHDGWFNQLTQNSYLGESVVMLVNPSVPQMMQIYGSDIYINTKDQMMTSKQNIYAIQGQSKLYSSGFSYNHNTHILTLTSNVKVIYNQSNYSR